MKENLFAVFKKKKKTKKQKYISVLLIKSHRRRRVYSRNEMEPEHPVALLHFRASEAGLK